MCVCGGGLQDPCPAVGQMKVTYRTCCRDSIAVLQEVETQLCSLQIPVLFLLKMEGTTTTKSGLLLGDAWPTFKSRAAIYKGFGRDVTKKH